MAKIESKDWKAGEDREPGPSEGVNFYVEGSVRTSAGNQIPILRKAEPQGINPNALLLDLTIEKQGSQGTDDFEFRNARYEEIIAPGAYTSVDIRHNGDNVAKIDAIEVAE